MYVYVYVHVCVGPEIDVGVFLNLSLSYFFFETGSLSLNLELIDWLGRLANKPQRSTHLGGRVALGLQACCHTGFYAVLRI